MKDSHSRNQRGRARLRRVLQDTVGLALFGVVLLCLGFPAAQPWCFTILGGFIAALPIIFSFLIIFGSRRLQVKASSFEQARTKAGLKSHAPSVRPQDPYLLSFLLVTCVLGSGWFFFDALQGKPVGWIEVPVTIQSSKVVQARAQQFGEKKETYGYQPSIRFSYFFNGQSYSSLSNGGLRFQTRLRGAAEQVADRYDTGFKAQAWVNPKQPLEAKLKLSDQARFAPQNVLLFGFSSAFLSILLLVLSGMREKSLSLLDAAFESAALAAKGSG